MDVTPLDLDRQLCFSLYRASRAVTRAYRPLLEELGLTYPQYLVMLVLWQEDGPVGVNDIGARLGLDSGTLTPLLRRLDHAGLVTRARSADDERRRLISLAPAGRDLRARTPDHTCSAKPRSRNRRHRDAAVSRCRRAWRTGCAATPMR